MINCDLFCKSGFLAIATLLLFGFSPTAVAQEIKCTGVNLMPGLEESNPGIAKSLTREAKSIPYGRGITWKVEKPGIAPSFVFGTIHLADPRLLKLRPEAQVAFDASKTLALEVSEVLHPEKLASSAFKVLQFTTYTDGTNLSDKLTDDQTESVKQASLSKLGLPWSVASKMKPWALMGALSLPACEMQRKQQQQPIVDTTLGLMAQEQGKKIVGLETVLSQLKAMDSLPEEFSVRGLVQSVSLGKRMDDLFETMVQLYLQEETAMIWAMMRRVGEEGFIEAQESSQYANFQKEIVDKRNFAMVDAAQVHLSQGGLFIAVGALHLPGEKGILNILAQKGYTISRIQ